jgi:hypothetical protein
VIATDNQRLVKMALDIDGNCEWYGQEPATHPVESPCAPRVRGVLSSPQFFDAHSPTPMQRSYKISFDIIREPSMRSCDLGNK